MAAKANSNNEKSLQEATELMEKGDMLAESFMGIFAMFATSWKGIGIATYALAKSWGALQAIAEEEGVNVKELFEISRARSRVNLMKSYPTRITRC